MEKIWTILMLASMLVLLIASPEIIIKTMIEESKNVVTMCFNLVAIYAVWLGMLEILDKSGLGEKLAKVLSPLIKKLFKIKDTEQIKYISYNISANILGLGNAATPSGIKAVKTMEKDLPKTKFAILMLIVVNSTSIQLLPTTVIGLRASAGSNSPSDIILPSLLASIIATVFGILVLLLYKKIKGTKL